MESLLSIWKRHNAGKGTGENWHIYPHWFRAHESMRAEAESYAASLAELEEVKRAFVVRGHMEVLRQEWARLYAAEYGGGSLQAKGGNVSLPPHPGAWAAGTVTGYNLEHARGVCSNSRGSCAVALHYFAEYVARALAAFGVEWGQQKPGEGNKPGGIALPLELDTDEAREKFAEAVARGWMIEKGDGYEWRGVAEKGKRGQLAYFCGRVYGYERGATYEGNTGAHVPYQQLERLFSETRLDRALSQVYEAKKPQPWRRLIDEIF